MKLLDYKKEIIERGTIFRCKANHPYEKVVEFLVCESTNINNSGYMLIVSTGYKAGMKFCQFPQDSIPKGYRMGLSKNWLLENWDKWGYFDCKIEDVEIFENALITNRE